MAAIAIIFLGISAITKIPADIFPNIDIPVVTVVWTYTGLSPKEVEQRITTYSEFQISNTVGDIKNIESQSIPGVSVQRIYFQPTVNVDLAIAQIVSITNSVRSQMPPGINPPIIIRFSASSVPVLQLAIHGKDMTEQKLYDYGLVRVRQEIASVPGATVTSPYGGKPRQIMVDLDPDRLLATNLTPLEVTRAISAQNLTVPSGQMKIGWSQSIVQTNATPSAIEALSSIPIREVNGTMIYVRDVAHVRDGTAVQQNIVRVEGRRSVLMTVLKSGNASTLDVVTHIKNASLPIIRAAAPKGLEIDSLFDQSVFVTRSIDDVVKEGVISAGLTAIMILLFLGSWRSTLVVLVSIPLALLFSLTLLYAMGQTMNIMTLGGLALSIGILVDHATITIENTHRLMEEGEGLLSATIHGAIGVGKPALVATVAICAAFVSVLFLSGPARYLFVPQALAVVFAILASYGLSRTLVPICINAFLHGETHNPDNRFDRFHARFNRGFDVVRNRYAGLLILILQKRSIVPIVGVILLTVTGVVAMSVGLDYFPDVDAGQIRLHVRARSGLRIEETERLFQTVEDAIRDIIPENDRDLLIDNIGLPASNTNLAYNDNSLVGLNDGQILLSLKDGHRPTAPYVRTLRLKLAQQFPDVTFYFQPADMMTQILNFGLPAPIDVQVIGRDVENNQKIAKEIRARLRDVTGAADVHLHQITDAPALQIAMDRERAAEFGVDAQTLAQNLNVSLSSSYQVSPNFWTDPRTGVPYPVAVQTPEYRMDRLSALKSKSIISGRTGPNGSHVPTLLSNVATVTRDFQQTVANHTNIQPVFDVYANVQGRDLGAVAHDLEPIIKDMRGRLAAGNTILVRGQIASMSQAFAEIRLGLVFSAVFVYLLMVLNFQTWMDPFIVICSLPATMCGIVLLLFVTGTTFSIPSLMGAVMSVGVASANSILLVTFAKDLLDTGLPAEQAAIDAGVLRLRPVLMTAGAMIVGMLPMALNLGGGGEANASLARAVIGGLLLGTAATLFVVPYFYVLIRGRRGTHQLEHLQ